MKILHVNYTDLVGGRFTGYYMQQYLDDSYSVEMAVWDKRSKCDSVKIIPPNNTFLHVIIDRLIKFSSRFGLDRLLGFGGYAMQKESYFKEADIVHIHLIHNFSNFSILSLPQISNSKPLVWTLHDPWAFTGGCEHSFDCNKWMSGCKGFCPHPRAKSLFMHHISNFHWNVKKKVYSKTKMSLVVASQWMYEKVEKSPLLKHFPCYQIPFGIDLNKFKPLSKCECKSLLGIPENHKVIAFRDNGLKSDRFKGMKYLMEALKIFSSEIPVTLLIFENGEGFKVLGSKFNIVTTGWIDGDDLIVGLSAADVFVMPSIQESFGLMAVEAMACETPVIVFDGTALPYVIKSPLGGISVPSKDIQALSNAIKQLIEDDQLRYEIGKNGRHIVENNYSIELYIKRHVELYNKIIVNYNKNI